MSYITTVKAQGADATQQTSIEEVATTTVSITQRHDKLLATLDGQTFPIDWQQLGSLAMQEQLTSGGRYSLRINDHLYDIFVRELPQEDKQSSHLYEVEWHGQSFTVSVEDEHTRLLEELAQSNAGSGTAKIHAPMPGLVTQTLVTIGNHVKAGQVVIILEAMKMENDLTAPIAGTIKELKVSKGDTVDHGQLLITVEHEEQE